MPRAVSAWRLLMPRGSVRARGAFGVGRGSWGASVASGTFGASADAAATSGCRTFPASGTFPGSGTSSGFGRPSGAGASSGSGVSSAVEVPSGSGVSSAVGVPSGSGVSSAVGGAGSSGVCWESRPSRVFGVSRVRGLPSSSRPARYEIAYRATCPCNRPWPASGSTPREEILTGCLRGVFRVSQRERRFVVMSSGQCTRRPRSLSQNQTLPGSVVARLPLSVQAVGCTGHFYVAARPSGLNGSGRGRSGRPARRSPLRPRRAGRQDGCRTRERTRPGPGRPGPGRSGLGAPRGC
jgi:hypothetical protein